MMVPMGMPCDGNALPQIEDGWLCTGMNPSTCIRGEAGAVHTDGHPGGWLPHGGGGSGGAGGSTGQTVAVVVRFFQQLKAFVR